LSKKSYSALPALGALALLAFVFSLAIGQVAIPVDGVLRVLAGGETGNAAWDLIVRDVRLPKALTALLAGAALSVAGLQMQTLFRNPLADPFVLGISSGASLGVALVVLGAGAGAFGRASGAGALGMVSAAAIGAGVVFALVMAVARRVSSMVTLLVLGLMTGYVTSALVSLLVHFSIPEQISTFTAWSFGSFGGVTWAQLRVFAPVTLLGLGLSAVAVKPLNALLLGEDYARSLGVNVRAARRLIALGASLLAGAVTAFCGPVAFIGVAVPHVCRALLRGSDHRRLLPAAALLGGALALICDLIAQLPGARVTLPLNVVTALFGAPLVLWIILRRGSGARV
jgi:iron complex transport system permease protein